MVCPGCVARHTTRSRSLQARESWLAVESTRRTCPHSGPHGSLACKPRRSSFQPESELFDRGCGAAMPPEVATGPGRHRAEPTKLTNGPGRRIQVGPTESAWNSAVMRADDPGRATPTLGRPIEELIAVGSLGRRLPIRKPVACDRKPTRPTQDARGSRGRMREACGARFVRQKALLGHVQES